MRKEVTGLHRLGCCEFESSTAERMGWFDAYSNASRGPLVVRRGIATVILFSLL